MNWNIKNLHQRLCVVALASPIVRNASVIIAIAGIIVITLRVNNISVTPPYIVSFFVIILATSAITILLKRHTLPSHSQVTSMLDNHGRCGGLLMARKISGSQAWQPKDHAEPLTISWSNPPLLITFFATFLFLLLALYLPIPTTTLRPSTLQLGKALTKIEEQIDTMESLDMLEDERAELFRKELEALEKERSAENPATSWEAIDQLTENLTSKANDEIEDIQNKLTEQSAMNEMVDAVIEMWEETEAGKDLASMAAMELADLLNNNALSPELAELMKQSIPKLSNSNSLNSASLSKEDMKKLSDALNSLSAEELAKLRELFEQGLMNSSQMQSCQNARILTAEELREMLRQQCNSSSCTNSCTNLSSCISASMLCQSACSSGQPGSGGVNRGPGHAALEFSGNTEENGFLFDLQALPKGTPQFKQNKLVGISATTPQVNSDDPQSSGGVLATENAKGAATVSSSLLPQHRSVVQNYFLRKTNSKKDRNNI